MDDLEALADAAVDEQSFIAFVEALRADREAEDAHGSRDPFGRGSRGWENHNIESFLEAALAWARDSAFGANMGLSKASPWRKVAVFLLCGKIYE